MKILGLVLIISSLTSCHRSDTPHQIAEKYIYQKGIPSGNDLYRLALYVKDHGDKKMELAERTDSQIDELLDRGDFMTIAAAAWALHHQKSAFAKQLQALLESRIENDGSLRGCINHCQEATALTYLALADVNPLKSARLEANLKKILSP